MPATDQQQTGIAVYSFKTESVTRTLRKSGKNEIIDVTISIEGYGSGDTQFAGPIIGFWLTADERICVRHGKKYNLQPAPACEGGFQCPLCKGGMLEGRASEYRGKKGLDRLYDDVQDAIWTKTHPNITRDEASFLEYCNLATSQPEKIVRVSEEDFLGKHFFGMQVIVKANGIWKPVYTLGRLVPEEEKETWLDQINWASWETIAYMVTQTPGGFSDLDGWVIEHVAKDKDGQPLMVHDQVKLPGGKIGEITQVSGGTLIVMPNGKNQSSTTARPNQVHKVLPTA